MTARSIKRIKQFGDGGVSLFVTGGGVISWRGIVGGLGAFFRFFEGITDIKHFKLPRSQKKKTDLCDSSNVAQDQATMLAH